MRMAKDFNIPIFVVGHVTKSGEVAGPKVLEHIVDTTLYMEGEHGQTFRLLRVNKNRFGKTDEVQSLEGYSIWQPVFERKDHSARVIHLLPCNLQSLRASTAITHLSTSELIYEQERRLHGGALTIRRKLV